MLSAKTLGKSLGKSLNVLNDSRLFAGIVMIILNIGSKYINIPLSPVQEKYVKNNIGKQLLVFSVAWLGSRDVLTSLLLTSVFFFMTGYLFNEDSALCVLPESWKDLKDQIDTNDDGELSEQEIERAIELLRKANQKKKLVGATKQ